MAKKMVQPIWYFVVYAACVLVAWHLSGMLALVLIPGTVWLWVWGKRDRMAPLSQRYKWMNRAHLLFIGVFVVLLSTPMKVLLLVFFVVVLFLQFRVKGIQIWK